MIRLFIVPLLILGLAACRNSGSIDGTVYYADPVNGNDLHAGTSLNKPWKTLEKINAFAFKPGDQVLLKTGKPFRGTLRLKNLHGRDKAPIVFSSYGAGRAAVESGDSLAILAENCSHLVCKNLTVIGSGRLSGNRTDGILFRRVKYGTIDSVDATGYLYSGIHIEGGSDLSITHVYAYGNGFSGIFAESGEPEYGEHGEKYKTLKRVYVAHSITENNPGCPVITDNHSGNGILIAGVVNGVIEYCESMNNGWDMPREGNGPVGIWAYMCDSITIQHCYSHHNKTSPQGKDGGGFDFDGGMRYSVMQFNLSAFNEGAGYGIFQYAGASEWAQNLIRYNISFNDGSKNSQAGIFMWCDPVALPMKDFQAYNNTIVSSQGLGVNFEPGAYEDFVFENNIMLITGKTSKFVDGRYTKALFDHNLYWSSYHQNLNLEQPKQNIDLHALQADPGLLLPVSYEFSIIKPDMLKMLSWFLLDQDSPCRQAGKIIQNNGGYDFWNNPVPVSEKPNLGAWQGN